MTVTIKHPLSAPRTVTVALHVYESIRAEIDSDLSDQTEQEVRALRRSYARLVEVLAEKGILSADDLNRVTDSSSQITSLNP